MTYIHYIEYSTVTFAISFFFAMAGAGGAAALVPIFNFMGLGFNIAKTIGLFINTSSTVTSSFMNFKRGVLDVRFAMPLIISSMLLSPLGAYSSTFFNEIYVKTGYLLFLLLSATLLVVFKKQKNSSTPRPWTLYVIGAVVGYISGVLGIGGGALMVPLMIFLGFEPKKTAVAVSFMIPFSTFTAFLSYLSFVTINWNLLFFTAVAAVAGGYAGNAIMHFKLKERHMKLIMATILYLLAIKMAWDLFGKHL